MTLLIKNGNCIPEKPSAFVRYGARDFLRFTSKFLPSGVFGFMVFNTGYYEIAYKST